MRNYARVKRVNHANFKVCTLFTYIFRRATAQPRVATVKP